MALPRIKSPLVRGSYCHLVTPRAGKPRDDGSTPPAKYSMSLLVRKDDPAGKAFIKALLEQVAQATMDKFGKSIGKDYLKEFPIRDGDKPDEDGNVDEVKAGCYVVRTSNTRKISVVNAHGQEITDDEDAYSGAYYKASVSVWAWHHKESNGKGVSINLHAVVMMKDGERLGAASVNAADEFADELKPGTAGEASLDDDDLLGDQPPF